MSHGTVTNAGFKLLWIYTFLKLYYHSILYQIYFNRNYLKATVEELQAVIKSAVILDVRAPDEIQSKGNGIPGHINVTYDASNQDKFINDIKTKFNVDKENPIIVHWNAGGRASKAKGIWA